MTEPANTSRGTILLAEDDRHVRTLVCKVLLRAGYTVIEACDGLEALEALSSEVTSVESVDVVLTDVVMPRMTGPELAARVAELAPRTPVLFMSGYTETGNAGGAQLPSDAVLLRKPFSPNEVLDQVKSLIAG